jgi:hypothetical protein
MNDDRDIEERITLSLRRSYGRFAAWIVRLNRMLEPARLAEPTRTEVPPRIAIVARQPLPPRPD